MGAFFVFFSTSPRVLIERLGLSQIIFSAIFATVAFVMIITTRFARFFVSRWGVEGSLIRGLFVILMGACILTGCTLLTEPSILTFVLPMWLIAVGMVLVVQSLIVGIVGTIVIVTLPGDSAWPLIAYCLILVTVTLFVMAANRLMRRS